MHPKRGKPKSARAGCLLCKPHKHQAEKHHDRSRRKRDGRRQVEQWHEAADEESPVMGLPEVEESRSHARVKS